MDEWKKVEDELPESAGRYLACFGNQIFIAHFMLGNNTFPNGKWTQEGKNQPGVSQAVTHWMSLPKPPEK